MNKNDMHLNSFQRDEALVVTDYSNKFAEWPHVSNSNNKTIQFSPTPSNTDAYTMSTSSSPTIENTVNDRRSSISPSPSILKKKQQQQSSPIINDMEPNTPPIPAVAPTPPGKSPIQNIKKAAVNKRRDSKSIKRTPTEIDTASVKSNTPIANKDEDINIIQQPMNPLDTILSKAEGFLKNVKETIKKTSASPDSVSHSSSPYPSLKSLDASKELDGNPHQRLFSFPDMNNTEGLYSTLLIGTKTDQSPNLTQVDWLIRGIPEVYEEDFEIDDEAVDKLLKEGGTPPSQLVFPSYHASSQRKMAKFKDARFLYINLTHFLIYSARYGVRRDCSHIAIRPPLGCTLPANKLTSALIPLTELDPNKEERKRKKSLLGDYFVGDCTIDENIHFPIQLDDSVISKWMDAKEEGCLRIELYSYMVSPNSHARQSLTANPICFGYVNIPLAGLLCTETLDAVVNCEIQVEADTHASVLSRMRSMPYSHSVDFSKPLGMKMGSLSMRLSVLSGTENSSAVNKANDIVSPLLIPQYNEDNPYPMEKAHDEKSKVINVIDSALAYQPVELPIGKTDNIIDSSAFFGTVIYDAQLNISNESNILRNIIISFKISKEIREEMSLVNVLNKSKYAEVTVNHIHNVKSWILPAFEVWVVTNIEKRLVGLARFDINVRYGDIVTVPIICIKTTNTIGNLVISLHMHNTRDKVDDNVFATITKMRHQLHQVPPVTIVAEETIELPPPTISAEPNHHTSIVIEESVQNMYVSVDSNVSIDSLTIDDRKETTSGTSSIFDITDDAKGQYDNIIAEINDNDSCINSKLDDMEAMLKIVSDRINDASTSSLSIDQLKEEELITMAQNILLEEGDQKATDIEPVTVNTHLHDKEILVASSSRLLDIIIEGTSDMLDNSETCLGFYITYTLPSLFGSSLSSINTQSDNPMHFDHKLWWDNKCSVLNTSNRHKFDVPNEMNNINQDDDVITFYIVTCDDDDKLSSHSNIIGSAILRVNELNNMLVSGSISRTFNLDISSSTMTNACAMKLNISHRIEPTLLRSSTSKLVSEFVQVDSLTETKNAILISSISNSTDNVISLDVRKDRQGFVITIEEVTHLPCDAFSKDSLLLLTGSAGFTNSVAGTNNSTGAYIPGAESFITSTQKASKNVSWNESQEIWVHKPDSSMLGSNGSDNKFKWLRDATLLISLHLRQSWPLPYMYDTPSGFERPFATDSDASIMLKVGDQIIGSAAIDLSPFSFGMPCIDGWYHIVDHLQQQKGQIKISINLQESTNNSNEDDNVIDNTIKTADNIHVEQPSSLAVDELLNNSDGNDDVSDDVRDDVRDDVIDDVSDDVSMQSIPIPVTVESDNEVNVSTSFTMESHANDEAKISFNNVHHDRQEFSESKSYYEDESKDYMSSSSSSSSSSSPISFTHDDDEYDNRDDSNNEDKTASFVEPYNGNYYSSNNNGIYVANSDDDVDYDVDDDDYEGNADIEEDYIDDFEEDDDSSYNDDDVDVDYDDYVVVDNINESNTIDENDLTESLYSVKADDISPPSSSTSSLAHGTMVSDTSSSELLVPNEVVLSDESSSSVEITRRNDNSYTKDTLNDSSIVSVKKQSPGDDGKDNTLVGTDDNDDDNDDVEMESLDETSLYNISSNDKAETSYYISEQSLPSYHYGDGNEQPEARDHTEISRYDDDGYYNKSSLDDDCKLDLTVDHESVSSNDNASARECAKNDSNEINEEHVNSDDYEADDHKDPLDMSLDQDECYQHVSLSLIETSVVDSVAKVDSPLTSKIRRVVDQEISKIALISQTFKRNVDDNDNTEDNNSNIKLATQSHDDDVLCNNDDITNINTSISTNTHIIEPIIEKTNIDDSPSSIISKVAELIANNNANSSGSNKRPGRQRQFIDAETERVSKIMLSKLLKK